MSLPTRNRNQLLFTASNSNLRVPFAQLETILRVLLKNLLRTQSPPGNSVGFIRKASHVVKTACSLLEMARGWSVNGLMVVRNGIGID